MSSHRASSGGPAIAIGGALGVALALFGMLAGYDTIMWIGVAVAVISGATAFTGPYGGDGGWGDQ